MSVLRGDRNESKMQFLFNARELQIYTIRKCVNFPKRYTFYVSQQIANSATRVYECVKKGNSIYPLNKHEAQMRRDYFHEANAELQSLISQIEVAKELFEIEAKTMEHWLGYIDDEIRLLKALMKTERERYKDLPD